MRVRRLLIPLLATVALGAGCGQWRDEDAARVDGATVTMAELRDEVDVLVEHPTWPPAFQVDVSAGAQASEQSATLVAWLNRRITDLAIDEELVRRDIVLDDDARARAEGELRFQLELYGEQASQSGQPAAPLDQFDQLPAGLRTALVEREAAREALASSVATDGAEPLPATAEEWFEANEGNYERYCVSIIVSADEASSNGLLARLEAGEDFAAVASTESLDSATAAQGGAADCAMASQLTPELAGDLAAAEVNDVVGPLQLANGWFLIKLTGIEPPSFQAAEGVVRVDRLNARQIALNDWLSQASPSVTVAPRLGTWDAEMFQVAANTGPLPANQPANPAGGQS
ncbi:MAG: hypothetical protein GEV08_08885 [Acidimicrobiia bacterium]|nr:hypothetical protein [Acidimicrobiia bacterium]